MSDKNVRVGFDVKMDKGSTWKPLKIQFWKEESAFEKFKPSEPFKYMADALVGLSLFKLNPYLKSPMATPHMNFHFATEAWAALDPHIELYERSQARVRALQSHIAVVEPALCKEFESKFSEHFDTVMKPWGMDISALGPLLETFAWFEGKIGAPLLYHFGVNFSKGFTEKLHTLFSLLYHLRNIVAIDHNAHAEDISHEGVKVDAISDYLPRAEYVVNDAILYWNFKKFSMPFSGPKAPDSRVDKLFVSPMEKAFHKYSHNACHLVDHLPHNFISSLNPLELEEAFYLVQIDWLMGSPAGLLFKIREEIFALQSGYEKIFWKDVEPKDHKKSFSLHLCCEIKKDSFTHKKAA